MIKSILSKTRHSLVLIRVASRQDIWMSLALVLGKRHPKSSKRQLLINALLFTIARPVPEKSGFRKLQVLPALKLPITPFFVQFTANGSIVKAPQSHTVLTPTRIVLPLLEDLSLLHCRNRHLMEARLSGHNL
jgi:hypothetical protein